MDTDRIDWAEAITDVPTENWLEGLDLDSTAGLDEAVDVVVLYLEGDDYLTWEAVIRQEQGLPLSAAHESKLDDLISFCGEEDDEILYINERARPLEPWYASLRKLAPKLVMPTFNTAQPLWAWMTEGWPRLADALAKHANELELPEGVQSPADVVPLEVRHRLRLQSTFELLGGLGEFQSMSDEQGQEQLCDFVAALRDHKDSVDFLELSLDSLLEILRLPPNEESAFVEAFLREVTLPKPDHQIAPHL